MIERMAISKRLYLVFFSLVILVFCSKVNAFFFDLKSVGTPKKTATVGDVITYNAFITVNVSSPLSFHVSLPFFQNPIMNVEKVSVLGVGPNLQTLKPTVTKSSQHLTNLGVFSQASIDLGNVTRHQVISESAGDELVIQVDARLLEHPNVTDNSVFWMYYALEYLDQSVWVIGKSIKADIQHGLAKLGAELYMRDFHVPTITFGFEVTVKIYHLSESRSPATGVKVTLSFPSFLTLSTVTSLPSSLTTSHSVTGGNTLTLQLTDPFKPGDSADVKVKFSMSNSLKGKFAKVNIYGDLEYVAVDENSCAKTFREKNSLQLGKTFYVEKDECDEQLTDSAEQQTTVSSAKLPCCGSDQSSVRQLYGPVGWEPWGNSSVRLADEFLQRSFAKKTTITRVFTYGYSPEDKFVKTFFLSYSQDGVFWTYVNENGKRKEFVANTDAKNRVYTVFDPPITARYFRFHLGKRSPAGASLKLQFFGCKDEADTLSYEVYQRGYLFHTNVIYVCNVHSDKTKSASHCYTTDDQARWKAIHPRVVNIIGYDPGNSKGYGLGLNSDDTAMYMELNNTQSFRVITESDWNSIKSRSGLISPKVIPLYPVHGDPMFEIPGTETNVGVTPTYVATPEGLVRKDSGSTKMIASWAEYKV